MASEEKEVNPTQNVRILNEVGGLPFIDTSFLPSKLLTLAACVRRNIDGQKHELSVYAQPNMAHAVYQQVTTTTPLPHGELSLEEYQKVECAIRRIVDVCPAWRPMFGIRVDYYKLHNHMLSSSNPLIPQHIFFGADAFRSKVRLEEIVIHEMSHVWSSLIAEISDFQDKENPGSFVLPSGIADKNARGVLLASLFAASVLIYFRALPEDHEERDYAQDRFQYLGVYLDKSLDSLESSPSLTATGLEIKNRLREFSVKFK